VILHDQQIRLNPFEVVDGWRLQDNVAGLDRGIDNHGIQGAVVIVSRQGLIRVDMGGDVGGKDFEVSGETSQAGSGAGGEKGIRHRGGSWRYGQGYLVSSIIECVGATTLGLGKNQRLEGREICDGVHREAPAKWVRMEARERAVAGVQDL
jgi:hypothetical protein